MSLLAVWSDDYLAHDANWLVWAGIRFPGDEEAVRAEVLHDELERAGVEMMATQDHGRGPIEAVHVPEMVDYLETAYQGWVDAGYPEDHGADRVVPYAFPHPDAFGAYPSRFPKSRAAMAGVFGMDTATIIGPGTYRGARAAVDGALTAASMVRDGVRAVYAPVRPPGHHAGTTYFGGSCYLNNVAVAANWLVTEGGGPIAIVDIDAHHGNGTQQIFYERADVLFVSIHADPATDFPYFLGYVDETGAGEGRGFNRNLPLPAGTGWDDWSAALDAACGTIAAFAPDTLVVSLGMDTFSKDPLASFRLESDDYLRMGARIARLARPTLFLMEGGYALEELGLNVANVLRGYEDAAPGF